MRNDSVAVTARTVPWVSLGTFAVIQAVLACWWVAFYPGLFSRDSVLYLSHTMVGPWVSDHSVLYDALLWLSVRATGDIGMVTFAQTSAMACALTYLAESLKALGAPRAATTAVALVLPAVPTVGAFTVTFWKDVPFTICAIAIAATCARLAADRRLSGWRLAGLGTLFLALGLFRANGFLVTAVAVAALVVVVRAARVRLALVGTTAAAVPLLLTNVVLPQAGISAPSPTYVYHTAFGDIAVVYRSHPELFDERDRDLLRSVAPLMRWTEGGTCYTINPLIWRRDFRWASADAHAGELLELWRRLLLQRPDLVIDARLCRGSIAWRITGDELATGGMTYRFSLRENADSYVGPGKVPDFRGRWVFSLRPLSPELNRVATAYLVSALDPRWDWVLWRGAFWSYLSYVAMALAAWALRNRLALAVAGVVAGQQLAILANISAQDFRYLASPIIIGMLLIPLLLASPARLAASALRRLLRRRGGTAAPLVVPVPAPSPAPGSAGKADPVPGGEPDEAEDGRPLDEPETAAAGPARGRSLVPASSPGAGRDPGSVSLSEVTVAAESDTRS